jgi:hypothetical protein
MVPGSAAPASAAGRRTGLRRRKSPIRRDWQAPRCGSRLTAPAFAHHPPGRPGGWSRVEALPETLPPAGHRHQSGQGRLPGAPTARLPRMRRLIAWRGGLMTAGSADTGREGRGGRAGDRRVSGPSGVSSWPSVLSLMPSSGRPNRGFGRQRGRAGQGRGGRRCTGQTVASSRGGIGAEILTNSGCSAPTAESNDSLTRAGSPPTGAGKQRRRVLRLPVLWLASAVHDRPPGAQGSPRRRRRTHARSLPAAPCFWRLLTFP